MFKHFSYVKNPDILKEISEMKKGHDIKIVGFCAESENLIENAKTKTRIKELYFI